MNRHAAPDPDPAPASPLLDQAEAMLRRRRFAQRWMLVLAGMDVGTGLAYLTGPTAAPNLQLVAQVVPIGVCALLFALVGVGLAAGLRYGGHWYSAAGFVGSVLWLIWGGALMLTVVAGTAPSAVGLPLYGGLAAMHMLVVYGAWTRLIGRPWQ